MRKNPKKVEDAADFIFLRTCLFWLLIPRNQRHELIHDEQYPTYHQNNVLVHAIELDKLDVLSNPDILDQINVILSAERDPLWPRRLLVQKRSNPDSSRFILDGHTNLMAFVLINDMTCSLKHKLSSSSTLDLAAPGDSPLHLLSCVDLKPYGLISRKNETLKLLLSSGSDPNSRSATNWKAYTPFTLLLRSVGDVTFDGLPSSKDDLVGAISMYLDNGADPNCPMNFLHVLL